MPVSLSDIVGRTEKLATLTEPGAVIAQGTSNEASLGTISWTGVLGLLPPSGAITKTYSYSLSGRVCTIAWRIKATTPGLAVTQASCPFPAAAPAPFQQVGTENDEWVYIGSGGILGTKSDTPSMGSSAGIYRDASGDLQLRINSGSVSVGARFAKGIVTYITEG